LDFGLVGCAGDHRCACGERHCGVCMGCMKLILRNRDSFLSESFGGLLIRYIKHRGGSSFAFLSLFW
jgi:hypothetical protein